MITAKTAHDLAIEAAKPALQTKAGQELLRRIEEAAKQGFFQISVGDGDEDDTPLGELNQYAHEFAALDVLGYRLDTWGGTTYISWSKNKNTP